ncbi:hypothetical protein Tco_0117259 [Tanacetum coccineum]
MRVTLKMLFREGISPLIKCTSAIRQLAYGVNASFLDEYMQISERSSRMSLDHFCQAVMEIYGPEFFRKPTVTDVEKLYRHHEETHGFSGMLGSLDALWVGGGDGDWRWGLEALWVVGGGGDEVGGWRCWRGWWLEVMAGLMAGGFVVEMVVTKSLERKVRTKKEKEDKSERGI